MRARRYVGPIPAFSAPSRTFATDPRFREGPMLGYPWGIAYRLPPFRWVKHSARAVRRVHPGYSLRDCVELGYEQAFEDVNGGGPMPQLFAEAA